MSGQQSRNETNSGLLPSVIEGEVSYWCSVSISFSCFLSCYPLCCNSLGTPLLSFHPILNSSSPLFYLLPFLFLFHDPFPVSFPPPSLTFLFSSLLSFSPSSHLSLPLFLLFFFTRTYPSFVLIVFFLPFSPPPRRHQCPTVCRLSAPNHRQVHIEGAGQAMALQMSPLFRMPQSSHRQMLLQRRSCLLQGWLL